MIGYLTSTKTDPHPERGSFRSNASKPDRYKWRGGLRCRFELLLTNGRTVYACIDDSTGKLRWVGQKTGHLLTNNQVKGWRIAEERTR